MAVTLPDNSELRHRPRVREACSRLQEMISQLEPGAKLPTILELHGLLGMSVQTLHRAIQQLESAGIVECVNGVGVFVAGSQATALFGNIGLIGVYPENRYFSYLLSGVNRYAREHGLQTVLLNGCKDLNLDLCQRVDGVLMCDIPHHEVRLKNLPAHLPRVSMFVREQNVSNVMPDDYDGARLAVQHFLEHGHRRIACLMEKDFPEPRLRFAGYCDAMAAAGIKVDERWTKLTGHVFSLTSTQPPTATSYLEWGRNSMQQWLRQGWREMGCTAILVQNDTAAIGVMQTLQREGIKVPDEVSVIGFDGTETCDHVTPQLTSMKVPLQEIGYSAMELLNEQIHKKSTDLRNIMLPLRVRAGQSVARVQE